MALLRDFQSAASKHGAPATVAIIVLAIIGFIVPFSVQHAPIIENVAFLPSQWLSHPWTVLSYPFIADPFVEWAFLAVVFGSMWMYGMGGAVERDLGTRRFVIFWIVMTLLPAAVMALTMTAVNFERPLLFLFLPLSAITVAWATRNPTVSVMFMFVIPILGRWIGWLTVGIVLFDYGRGNPILGIAACVHLFVTWLYAMNKIPALAYGKEVFTRKREGWKPVERDDTYFEEVRKRETERAEREKLRKLLEGSIADDPEDKR